MSGLPPTRFFQSPMLFLASAISAGILLGYWYSSEARSTLILSLALITALTISSLLLARKTSSLASLPLVIAFLLTGYSLSAVGRRERATQLARLLDQGILATGEPVEVAGVIDGQPEPAPGSFYLTLRVEGVRFKNEEHA